MQIGKELKKLRLELGLSQTEMVGDILTKSYYSKMHIMNKIFQKL